MNAVSISTIPAWVGKALAILSVAFAWVLPWSPFLAIAALKTTTQLPGWRRLAIAGALLSVAFSIAIGLLMIIGLIGIWWQLGG